MSRQINQHIVEGDAANHQLRVSVHDEPGHGGACHEYGISHDGKTLCPITFQNGPIKEVGINGITHEALLAILIDRMEGFQAGAYSNENNGAALVNLRAALTKLQARTRARIARGVEGTHQP